MTTDTPTHRPLRLVLLVDDEPLVAAAHARLLVQRGHAVFVRHSHAEGMELVRAKSRFDVAVLDIDIGAGSEGLELGRQLLSHQLVERLVFCTATEDADKTEMAIRLGTFVPKGTAHTGDQLIAAVEGEGDPA